MSWLVSVGCLLLCATASSRLPPLDFTYHNHTSLTAYLRHVAAEYPHLATLYSVGHSVEKRELWVLEMSAAANTTLGVPNVKLIGNIHGNEPVGREVLLHLIEFLVTNYATNESVAWLLNTTRLHVLPSMNPDGFEVSTSGMCKADIGPGRKNKNGVDLNRNFPDYFSTNSIPAQPEMQSIVQWLKAKQFALSASLHGGALVANYPYDNTDQSVWEAAIKLLNDSKDEEQSKDIWRKINGGIGLDLVYKESLTPDNDVFRHLALVYSRTHPTMHDGHPCSENAKSFPDGITNGAAWYTFAGGMQDYNYWAHGCLEITLEIGCCKYPLAEDLPQMWHENKEALLALSSQAQRGVHGVIRDGETRLPIPGARFKVENRSMGFQSNQHGEFWRVLLPGQYHLEVYKAHYESLTVPFTVSESVSDERPSPTWLDVDMAKVGQRAVSHWKTGRLNTTDTTTDSPAVTSYQSDMTLSQHTYLPDNSTSESEARTLTNSGGGISAHLVIIGGFLVVVPCKWCLWLS